MPTVLVTAGNVGEKPPRIRVILRRVTEMVTAENKCIPSEGWVDHNIKIINVIITTCVNSSQGVKNI